MTTEPFSTALAEHALAAMFAGGFQSLALVPESVHGIPPEHLLEECAPSIAAVCARASLLQPCTTRYCRTAIDVLWYGGKLARFVRGAGRAHQQHVLPEPDVLVEWMVRTSIHDATVPQWYRDGFHTIRYTRQFPSGRPVSLYIPVTSSRSKEAV